MANLKITLGYDGTAYHGWQRQQNAITVQQIFEETLSRICKRTVTVNGCSRTDAGVHARRFVCNMQGDCPVPPEKLPYACNALLPEDIAVSQCEVVPEEFHARFDAVSKAYSYRVITGAHRDPFLIKRVWHYPYPLDIALMERAAGQFVGTHDFAAFRAAGSDTIGTVRTVQECRIVSEKDGFWLFTRANGYLYNMVRIMVGTLVAIGNGKLSPDAILDLLQSGERVDAGATAPPWGLTLEQVYYGREPEGNEQTENTVIDSPDFASGSVYSIR